MAALTEAYLAHQAAANRSMNGRWTDNDPQPGVAAASKGRID
jgi:hypothetical protein